jgi:hypothetical protein
MLDPLAVLDRFGDEEFLRELWLKARGQLSVELAGVEELRASGGPHDELGKRLHKLRGLISNFLEGGDAIARLRHCEEVCQQLGDSLPDEPWQAFRDALTAESAQLESWLTERGFPCP